MASAVNLGVIVIGRNEGERLGASLHSLRHVPHRVYVDSGSRDGSPALAERLGFQVVELTTPPHFTAARARNAGLQALLEKAPDLEFVQMVDGDCELVMGWLEKAAATLRGDPSLAAVFGRLRERYPQASVYNRLCDDEWDVPVGEALSCGGIAMFRARMLIAVGGFTPSLIAGEEPELCLRMRQRGGRILRIDAEMALHDANITRLSQWWRRSRRSGHAFAELAHRCGEAEENWRRQKASILLWGGGMWAGLLLAIVGLAGGLRLALFLAAIMFLVAAAQVARLAWHRWRRGHSLRRALRGAFFLVLGKLPQFQGLLQFHARRGRAEDMRLIEYKS